MSSNTMQFTQRKLKKNYRSITGYFPSVKNNISIGFESKLEKTFFLMLEFDDDVLAYQEQPQIKIVLDGRKKTYSADCFIKRVDSSILRDTLVEVKYTSELEKEKEYFEKKFKAIRQATDELDLGFIIFTEEDYSDDYISNLDFLYRYITQAREKAYDAKIKTLLKDKKLSAKDIAEQISESPTELMLISNAIWGLVADKQLSTDLHSSQVDMNSKVEVVN